MRPGPDGVPYDPEYARWQAIRFFYRIGLFLLIAPFAIFAFTNLIMFGKVTRLKPADFVPDAQQCAPTIRAIKQYQNDTGQWPDDLQKQLVPKYVPSIPWAQDIQGSQFIHWITQRDKYNHRIIYEFTPGAEGWTVKGPFANGPIPVPIVTLKP